MTRLEDWQERFHDVVERHSRLPFSWHESNCVYFVADVVEAITGEDPCAAERGCVDEQDFRRRLVAAGVRGVDEGMAARFPEIPPALAQRGDIGVVMVDGEACGVVVAGQHVLGKDRAGQMMPWPRSLMIRAFKVG